MPPPLVSAEYFKGVVKTGNRQDQPQTPVLVPRPCTSQPVRASPMPPPFPSHCPSGRSDGWNTGRRRALRTETQVYLPGETGQLWGGRGKGRAVGRARSRARAPACMPAPAHVPNPFLLSLSYFCSVRI